MFGSYRESHRRVHIAAVALFAVLVSGCATSQDRPQRAEIKCPPGTALFCTFKLGRRDNCSCEPEEKLDEIFSPNQS